MKDTDRQKKLQKVYASGWQEWYTLVPFCCVEIKFLYAYKVYLNTKGFELMK